MPTTKFTYIRVKAPEEKYGKGFGLNSLKKSDFDKFGPPLLGLGDISKEGEYVQALVAFCDLEGFTDFCNQVDSHLVIPEFMTRYIGWVFESLADKAKEGENGDTIRIWGSLPFYMKFLGDGLLFMWDTQYSGGFNGIRNIVAQLYDLGMEYQSEFLPQIRKHVSKPPTKLRCGVARGQVVSVGENEDYVGSCINIASRLQKLSLLSFAVSRRGLDLHREPCPEKWKAFDLVKTSLRGIGDQELVYVLREELDTLPEEEKALFGQP
jgi:class 3 adenylate cyclase